MTTAQSLIESGYARSTANDGGKLAVDGELIAYLNREYQSLHAVLAYKAGDNAAAMSTLTFSGTPATATLPTDIIDIVKIETAAGGRTYLVGIADKDRTYHLPPAMFRQGNSIISRGKTGDPAAGDNYALYYKDAPAAITGLNSTLDARFPVRYENILVLKIAIYLSAKDEGRSATSMQALQAELTMVLQAFGLLADNSNTAKEGAQQPASVAKG